MNKDFEIFLLICWIAFCTSNLIHLIYVDTKGCSVKLNCTYKKLISETLYYCGPFFKQHNIKYYPLIEISYFKSKTRLGCYYPGKKKIVIYVNSYNGSESEKILQIVNCTLHEVRHYFQDLKIPEFKNYDVLKQTLGYQNHPHEKDCNEWAEKNMKDCVKYLKQKGILS